MTPDPDIDGAIGQGWGGTAPDGVHVNVVLGRRGSPTSAALLTAFASPSPGHTPVLVCVGPDQPSYEAVVPPTVMMNKATATDERHQTLTWGAAQLGIGQGVLDAVAGGLLTADRETLTRRRCGAPPVRRPAPRWPTLWEDRTRRPSSAWSVTATRSPTRSTAAPEPRSSGGSAFWRKNAPASSVGLRNANSAARRR
jgi:Formaldehyde-activating enzyme (Fae)